MGRAGRRHAQDQGVVRLSPAERAGRAPTPTTSPISSGPTQRPRGRAEPALSHHPLPAAGARGRYARRSGQDLRAARRRAMLLAPPERSWLEHLNLLAAMPPVAHPHHRGRQRRGADLPDGGGPALCPAISSKTFRPNTPTIPSATGAGRSATGCAKCISTCSATPPHPSRTPGLFRRARPLPEGAGDRSSVRARP